MADWAEQQRKLRGRHLSIQTLVNVSIRLDQKDQVKEQVVSQRHSLVWNNNKSSKKSWQMDRISSSRVQPVSLRLLVKEQANLQELVNRSYFERSLRDSRRNTPITPKLWPLLHLLVLQLVTLVELHFIPSAVLV